MRDYYGIIKGPVITEKSTLLVQAGKVAFWVDPGANKAEVKEAVEKLFNVKVLDVNTEKVAGKIKRLGRSAGRRPTRKKAYVTLREGDKIELFEGV